MTSFPRTVIATSRNALSKARMYESLGPVKATLGISAGRVRTMRSIGAILSSFFNEVLSGWPLK